jgi:anti-sigma factor RsiW
MSCETWKDCNERLIGHLYGELDPAEEAELSAHLGSCADCREELARLSRARELLSAGAPALPAAPRVVVLRAPLSRRPALAIAASAFLAGLLAASGVFAGYRLGASHSVRDASALAATPSPASPSTLTSTDRATLEAAFEERLDRQRRELLDRIDRRSQPAAVTPSDLASAMDRMEKRVDGWRASDVEYVLGQLAASDQRHRAQIGQTQDALRYVALARDPRVSEQ